jgi:hypothetical protein
MAVFVLFGRGGWAYGEAAHTARGIGGYCVEVLTWARARLS